MHDLAVFVEDKSEAPVRLELVFLRGHVDPQRLHRVVAWLRAWRRAGEECGVPPQPCVSLGEAVPLMIRAGALERRSRYVPQLDGVRGVAILAVLLLHASVSKFPGGWIGVHVFFVLSGYLITTLLLQEWERTGRIGLGRFWVRRILRLVPAYWLVLVGFLLIHLPTTNAARSAGLWHEF